MNAQSEQRRATGSSGGLGRWLPVLAIIAFMVLVRVTGWYKYLSFEFIGPNFAAMKTYIAEHTLLAVLAYMAVYIASTALSLPGGLVLTLFGGLLFGWKLGIPATVVAATIGATILFLAVKTSFGELLAAKAGPSLNALREGFQKDAFNYLLFLRLVPAFPFVVVNLAPALLGVPFGTYVLGTFLGIIPGTAAFSLAGAGLGSVIEAQNKAYQDCIAASGAGNGTTCSYTIDTSALVTKELITALALLSVVALIPVVLKRLRGRHA